MLAQCRVYEPEARWLLDQVGVKNGSRVVDVGCGLLGIVDLLSGRVGATGLVVGLERDPRILEWARLSVAERRLGNVRLVAGDAEGSGLRSASFDMAHTRLLLINVRSPERVLSEMMEVVRPGGLVLVQEVDWYSWTCEPYHPAWGRLLQVNQVIQRDNGQDLFIGRRLPGLLRDGGLVDVGVKAHVHIWHRGHPLHTQLLAFTDIARETVQHRALLPESALTELTRELAAHLDHPGTLVIHPILFQAWGVKPRRD